MAHKPEDHHEQSQMDAKSNNTGEMDTQPRGNPTEQRKTEHVSSGNKYFILLTGNTLNSHVNFIDLLEKKIPSLQKVNTVEECDFILTFCPVASRAGTDIEGAEKRLQSISDIKPAVLVVLHHTFNPECVVPTSRSVVKRENTITVDCLFYEDQGLLKCRKNSDAIDQIHMKIKPKVQRTSPGTKGIMAEKPEDHHEQSPIDAKSNNTGEMDTQPRGNPTEQRKTEHVSSGNKYFILLTGKTLNSHVNFIDLLEQKIPSLQKVNTVEECDFILTFCPVVSRAGTDIEGAEKRLQSISDIKPAVLVVLHHTFNPECVVPTSRSVVKRKNTITVDCLFHEDQGLLQCTKNLDAIDQIHMKIKLQIQTASVTKGKFNSIQFNSPEYSEAADKTLQENKAMEDFKKEIDEMKLPKNNEIIISTELRLVLLGGDESEKTAARNMILGREEMNQAASSTAPVTHLSENTWIIAGMKVLVVDTPDSFSPGYPLEELSQTVEPQAFLLVIPVKYPEDEMQSDEETQKTVMKVEEIFATNCWRNTMILFTVSDELQKKNIESFSQFQNQGVQRLLEKCGNRFHCLNIKESGDGSQVLELLENIDKMMGKNTNRSQVYETIRKMEMARHAKDAWIRKIQIQIQKVLEKCEQFDSDCENMLKSLETGESTAAKEKMVNQKKLIKLRKEIAEKMKMKYDRIAKLETNRQFFKAVLSENQETIWISLPGEKNTTLNTEYYKVFQVHEQFLKIMEPKGMMNDL